LRTDQYFGRLVFFIFLAYKGKQIEFHPVMCLAFYRGLSSTPKDTINVTIQILSLSEDIFLLFSTSSLSYLLFSLTSEFNV